MLAYVITHAYWFLFPIFFSSRRSMLSLSQLANHLQAPTVGRNETYVTADASDSRRRSVSLDRTGGRIYARFAPMATGGSPRRTPLDRSDRGNLQRVRAEGYLQSDVRLPEPSARAGPPSGTDLPQVLCPEPGRVRMILHEPVLLEGMFAGTVLGGTREVILGVLVVVARFS